MNPDYISTKTLPPEVASVDRQTLQQNQKARTSESSIPYFRNPESLPPRGGRSGRGKGGHSGMGGGGRTVDAPPEIIDTFQELSGVLDELHDRRERIIKLSRDITICSKRMIFLLHRIAGINRSKILAEARDKQKEIIRLFDQVAAELKGNDFYRHHRSIGPGCEEFIEAASFLVYVERGELATKDELQKLLVNEEGKQILEIADEDYILGLADLTGELMRYCINSVVRGEHQVAEDICHFLRTMKNEYEIIDYPPAKKKMSTMRSSLWKVENACYAYKVRGAERPSQYFVDELQRGESYGYRGWEDEGPLDAERLY
ncbi:uncharacterized protein SPPG_08034 [Spizellomyces punctatus DAOM BR117]|uniref:Translin n=1 Tax=Spizellomyces punctatus (strain DAOM BR117) TaxID=645134 RepID=A0A0L0H6A5_SPIPD|nr:uncharacterized protein SPPG_08034 [Spizellomyces punctatus DAOM BR117]KNC96441.1 hypothetical protein SPPG_08034 [Spizellomyces punctatus DAOM BR117]|eukprot:XP_016604481.1 hypothetical protein SPPG_08034 [Spizellomyces punctatus DAOM BR117]